MIFRGWPSDMGLYFAALGTPFRDPLVRREAARLLYTSFQEFYDLFTDQKEPLWATLADLMEDPNSEVGSGRLAFQGGALTGIICFYPYSEQRQRQRNQLRRLLAMGSVHPEAAKRVATFSRMVEPVLPSDLYHARVAVTEEYRGRGCGVTLLQEEVQFAIQNGLRSVACHIRADNEGSIHLHRKIGFRPVSEQGSAYLHRAYRLSLV